MWYDNAYEENGVASPLLTWAQLCATIKSTLDELAELWRIGDKDPYQSTIMAWTEVRLP